MYKALSYCAEILVFLYLGIGMFTIDFPYNKMGGNLIIISIFAILIGRFANICGVSVVINLCCGGISCRFIVSLE